MSESRVPNRKMTVKRQLTEEEILEWAQSYHARHGKWPSARATPVEEAPELTWRGVDAVLQYGGRGLPGGSSLSRLLSEHQRKSEQPRRPPLTDEQIIAWAEAHRVRHRHWPNVNSGRIEGAADETWSGVDRSLSQGLRGLLGGRSLARLLAEHRSRRPGAPRAELDEETIFAWAEAYYRRHGRWPTPSRGPVRSAPGETWSGLDRALQAGTRGLRGGSSLAELIREREGGMLDADLERRRNRPAD